MILPDFVKELLTKFMTGGRTGQITLNFFNGRLKSVDTREHLESSVEVGAQKAFDNRTEKRIAL